MYTHIRIFLCTEGHKVGYEKKQQEQKIWADPDNEENQKYIAEQLRLENVQANMVTAMEELPEGRYTYITHITHTHTHHTHITPRSHTGGIIN